jgi:hypothetical protein
MIEQPADATPYADAASLYWDAGWRGILPLPPRRKASPPIGWTGRAGAWPGRGDVLAWETGPEGAGNLGLRLPEDVIGIDVDNYSGKSGADTLGDSFGKWGALPPTWVSTSRADGISGIRLYRVPRGLAWPGEVGPGIELVLFNHRYVVAWPSVHPSGNVYRWKEPGGPVVATGRVPRLDELPELPERWVAGLTGGRAYDDGLNKANLTDVEVTGWLVKHGGGPQCPAMTATVERYLTTRFTGDSSRHDAARDAVARLLFMAAEGHTGAVAAVNEIGVAFRAAIQDERGRGSDAGEWQRLYLGAVRLAVLDTDEDAPRDPCTITQGATPLDVGTITAEEAQRMAEAKLLDVEVKRQRLQRDARRQLDDEEAARAFRVPPSRLDLVAELALPDEPVTYAVADVLPTGGNALLTAQFKAGKTTLINHLARCFADGEPFLGRYAVTPPAGRVALFNYEVGEGMYRRWLRDLDVRQPAKISTLNLRGFAMPIMVPRVADWLVNWLTSREVSVWIVDPFARAYTGDNENDNTMVGRFLEALDVIKSRAGVSELILPTHTGRAEVEVGAERARGATRLDDWADVRWMLTKDESGARYFSATGRDVDTEECQLQFLPNSRALSVTGKGGRKDVEKDSLAARIRACVEATPGINMAGLALALHKNTNELRSAVNELVGAHLLRDEVGPRNSRMLFPMGPSQLFVGVVDE